MGDAKITQAQVRHVAALARLELTDGEVERMTRELGAILSHVAELEELDVSDVPPTSHAVPMASPLRDDVPSPGLRREEALASAPETRDGGFAVPMVKEG